MSFATSSTIGADFNNPSSTQLFALGTEVLGSGGSEWTYVVATGTLTTGMIVALFSAGTAYALTTALVAGGDAALTTANLALGAVQTNIPQGQFGWVARKGVGLYVATSGTVPPTNVGFSATAGTIVTGGLVAVGNTAAGIFITTSASTGTLATAIATLSFPRSVASTPNS